MVFIGAPLVWSGKFITFRLFAVMMYVVDAFKLLFVMLPHMLLLEMKFCTCIGVTHTVLSLFGICCWTSWWYIWAVTGRVIIPLIPTGKTFRKWKFYDPSQKNFTRISPFPSSFVSISWPSCPNASDRSTCMLSDCPSIWTVWTVVPSLCVWSCKWTKLL